MQQVHLWRNHNHCYVQSESASRKTNALTRGRRSLHIGPLIARLSMIVLACPPLPGKDVHLHVQRCSAVHDSIDGKHRHGYTSLKDGLILHA